MPEKMPITGYYHRKMPESLWLLHFSADGCRTSILGPYPYLLWCSGLGGTDDEAGGVGSPVF